MYKLYHNEIINNKNYPWNTDAPAGTQVNRQTDRETGITCNKKFEAFINDDT